MTFEESDAKLAQMCPGLYRDVKFHLTTYADGTRRNECALYIDGGYHTSYWATWELAFAHLEQLFGPFAQAPRGDVK